MRNTWLLRYSLVPSLGGLLLIGCAAGLCNAQNPPSASPLLRLSLADAVKLGLKQNPTRLIASILQQESDRTRDVARSALLPQANLVGRGLYAQFNLQSVFKSPPLPAGPYQVGEGGAAVTQSIFDALLLRRYQISREGARTAHYQDLLAREDVTQIVVQQYLLVLRAIADRDAVRARVALAQRLYDQAVQLEKTGIGTRIDTTRSQVELLNERQLLIDAETSTRTSKYSLAEILDLGRDQELELTDALRFSNLPTFDRAAVIAGALATRPEMKTIISQQRIALLSRKQASEQRLPRLTFEAAWSGQGEHASEVLPAYSYQLDLTIPIYTGGRISATISQAKLEEQRFLEQRHSVEAMVIREVKVALDELEAARQAVDVANHGKALADDEVAQADRRFNAGVSTNIEIITAQDELARASDNQIEALFRFNQSRANLARAEGQIESTYTR